MASQFINHLEPINPEDHGIQAGHHPFNPPPNPAHPKSPYGGVYQPQHPASAGPTAHMGQTGEEPMSSDEAMHEAGHQQAIELQRTRNKGFVADVILGGQNEEANEGATESRLAYEGAHPGNLSPSMAKEYEQGEEMPGPIGPSAPTMAPGERQRR